VDIWFDKTKEPTKPASISVLMQGASHPSPIRDFVAILVADWEIPQKLQLGDVSITAEVQSDRYSGEGVRSQVRISRYELPMYTVKVTPDRAYYLPGQNASVEVRADYLFGKAAQRAKVKVVRQENRTGIPGNRSG
jgi:Macroglobulin domain MG3